MSRFPAGALPLALLPALAPTLAHADAVPLDTVVVTAAQPQTELIGPAASAGVSAETLARTVNLQSPEDALRYLPDVVIRQRHVGDTQSPLATRTSGVGASARSLIYVDGMLISSLIGNNNTSASPKWGLVSPDAIARVDVIYGPFSAAYAGNSIGAVVLFTTRMPTALEGSAEVQGAWQGFSQYGDRKTYGTGRAAADLGDRFGRLAFRLSYNRLDASSQPLTYATATVPAAASPAGAPVTGAFTDANRTGQPIVVLGSTAIERQVQDNASGRATFDITPSLTAAYTFGVFHNADDATSNSYLRDASGAPVYAGPVEIGGRAYAIAPSAFSSGVYRMDELELAQGLSLASHGGGAFDFELAASTFDYLHSRQRIPSGALPAAFSGGPGSSNALDGTGWRTLDAKATWRPFGPGGAHAISFGAHQDGFRLDNPRYGLANWISGPDQTVQAVSRGRTQTQALWVQDAWALAPGLKATVGGRWEHWQASDGVNYSASPALNQAQPKVAADAFSPKGVLGWSPAPGWTLKGSVGLAYRFPTVTELYQSVTVGTQLQTPNPDLKPERALSSELSAERVWPSGNLRLSVFDERIAGALLSQTSLLPSGASASFVQNVERTRATGVELVAGQRLTPALQLSGWVTFVDARIERDAAFPAAVGKALPQLPRWRGAVVATWSPTPKLDVTLAGRYSDRAFATLDNSDAYANTYQGFSGYFVADLHIRWNITSHVQAGVGADNLLGRRYFLFHPFPQQTAVAQLKYAF
ncbi:MAG TPA: TonB-dependent receptor [Caulobacteraceae bacterium]|jgi:iron complex outermembrane receptor protein